jgi:GT2 family glycosyltransferase
MEMAISLLDQALVHFPESEKFLTLYLQLAKKLKLEVTDLIKSRAGLLLSLTSPSSAENCAIALSYLQHENTIGTVWLDDSCLKGWLIASSDPQQHHSLLVSTSNGFIEIEASEPLPSSIRNFFPTHTKGGFQLQLASGMGNIIDVICKQTKMRLYGSPVITSESAVFTSPYYPDNNKSLKIKEHNNTVNIIIPVFNNTKLVKQCIESIFNADYHLTHYKLIVINDASTETSLNEYLLSLKFSKKITLIINEVNLGYIRSVNIGIQNVTDGDIVLLNADTIVVNDWLDRLYNNAYSQQNIATVTPLSNNAEFFSFPTPLKINKLPSTNELKAIDSATSSVNKNADIYVPTGIGFCFFIRADCINQIGLFNETELVRGYSEESEFCLRASQNGWLHKCAADVFVGHHGGQSFSYEKNRLVKINNERIQQFYPSYNEEIYLFTQQDQLKHARKALSRSMIQSSNTIVLLVADNHTINHPSFESRLLELSCEKTPWILQPTLHENESKLSLFTSQHRKFTNLHYSTHNELDELINDIRKLNPAYIELHHSQFTSNVISSVLKSLHFERITLTPYDDSLLSEKKFQYLNQSISHIRCLTQHAYTDYNKPNYSNAVISKNFFQLGSPNFSKTMKPIVVIFDALVKHQQLSFILQVIDFWRSKKMSFTFLICEDTHFRSQLETTSFVQFLDNKDWSETLLPKLASHALIVPSTESYLPSSLLRANQYGLIPICETKQCSDSILTHYKTAIKLDQSEWEYTLSQCFQPTHNKA